MNAGDRHGVPPGQHRYRNYTCQDCGVLDVLPSRNLPLPASVNRIAANGQGWLHPDGLLSRQEPSCWFVLSRCTEADRNKVLARWPQEAP